MTALHKKLAHLTPEQVDDLVKRYSEGEYVTSLIEAFNIDATPGGLVQLLPPVVHKDLPCPYCPDTNLISKRPARTYNPRGPETPHCPECGHRHAAGCSCNPCKAKAEAGRVESDEKKRQVVEAAFTREHDMLSQEDLTLHDAVFLMAIARFAATDDLAYLKPACEYADILAPLPECQHEIITHLHKRGLIAISPGSDVNAFEFDEALTEIKSARASKVLWVLLPGLEWEENRVYFDQLKTLVSGGDWPDGWSRDVPKLWHFIVKNECLQQFVHLLGDRETRQHRIDRKIHALFDRLLVDFPPSRIFYLTWSAFKDTSNDMFISHIRYRKAISLRTIGRKADEAKAEGRELRHFKRDPRCPQTDISAAFFNDFLKLGDAAFQAVPPRWDGNCNGPVDIDHGGWQAQA